MSQVQASSSNDSTRHISVKTLCVNSYHIAMLEHALCRTWGENQEIVRAWNDFSLLQIPVFHLMHSICSLEHCTGKSSLLKFQPSQQ